MKKRYLIILLFLFISNLLFTLPNTDDYYEYYKDKLCDMIFFTVNNKTMELYYLFPGNIPNSFYTKYSNSTNEYNLIPYNAISNSFFSSNIYLIYEGKSLLLTNYNFYLYNSGDNFFIPLIKITTEFKFDPQCSFLVSEKPYHDYISRNKISRSSFKKTKVNNQNIKLNKFETILSQHLIDFNGDSADELLTVIEKNFIIKKKTISMKRFILKFNNYTNIIEGSFNALYSIPYHDYPVIKTYYSSENSGESGNMILSFKSNSVNPIYFYINTAFSD